jgi:hypothetical protein
MEKEKRMRLAKLSGGKAALFTGRASRGPVRLISSLWLGSMNLFPKYEAVEDFLYFRYFPLQFF